jgi:hypothetical protein
MKISLWKKEGFLDSLTVSRYTIGATFHQNLFFEDKIIELL